MFPVPPINNTFKILYLYNCLKCALTFILSHRERKLFLLLWEKVRMRVLGFSFS
jgi:hypothetical protein